MASAQEFQSVTASVFPSQSEETVIAKQSVMAEYGRDVRSIINQFPPEVTHHLLSEYREPHPQLMAKVQEAIINRELAIENSAQEVNLDHQWLQGEDEGLMDEVGFSEDDDWNTPSP
jgi:hypothetical protein